MSIKKAPNSTDLRRGSTPVPFQVPKPISGIFTPVSPRYFVVHFLTHLITLKVCLQVHGCQANPSQILVYLAAGVTANTYATHDHAILREDYYPTLSRR